MAANFHKAVAVRNAENDAITTYVGNAGKFRGYSGTQPANADAAITGTLLFELTCGSPFAGASASGVLTITNPTTANASSTGTLSHGRFWKADGTTPAMDGSAGTSSADIIVNTTSIVSGGPVAVSSATLTKAA